MGTEQRQQQLHAQTGHHCRQSWLLYFDLSLATILWIKFPFQCPTLLIAYTLAAWSFISFQQNIVCCLLQWSPLKFPIFSLRFFTCLKLSMEGCLKRALWQAPGRTVAHMMAQTVWGDMVMWNVCLNGPWRLDNFSQILARLRETESEETIKKRA